MPFRESPNDTADNSHSAPLSTSSQVSPPFVVRSILPRSPTRTPTDEFANDTLSSNQFIPRSRAVQSNPAFVVRRIDEPIIATPLLGDEKQILVGTSV